MRDLRRLAALALAALLLCGGALPCAAAASDATVAAEPDLPPEAESFYQSILAAMDQKTLQAYLGCFSRERQLELWSMLDTTRQRRLTQAMALLGQSPPTAAPTPDARTPSWELTGETAWDAETGCYTLRLEAWATAAQPPAALKYRLDPAMDASLATVRVWAVDKTHGGWSQVKRELPDIRVSLEDGLLTVLQNRTGEGLEVVRATDVPLTAAPQEEQDELRSGRIFDDVQALEGYLESLSS